VRRNRFLFLIVVGLAATAGAVLWLLPGVESARSSVLVRAWVGVEVDGNGVAKAGDVEVTAGQAFRLHAVLETEGRGEGAEPVYFSAVPEAEVDGRLVPTRPVEELGVSGWVRLLWFSIEHGVPFREPEHGAELQDFRYEPFFRPEWGNAWSIDGTLEAHFDSWLEQDAQGIDRNFGTLRYQVWVETSTDDDALVPDQRVKSAEIPGATRIVSRLPGVLGPPSAVFGLPGIRRGEGDWDAPAVERLHQLHRDRLAFHQVELLRAILEAGDTRWDDLDWSVAPLDGSVEWRVPGEGSPAPGDLVRVGPGDLVRVGDRWAVLFLDRDGEGEPERLDGADLCLDFDAEAAVRRLDQIFVLTEEGEGDVLVASLRGPA